MKPTPHENPDLTAYAVGELDACQARDIHALLAACPVATHELEQVEAVTDALRQGAPIPQERLRPEQRHAVLYPANLPRRMGPMMPRPIQRRPSVLWPVVSGILKAAAVLALTGAAYLVGRHVNVTSSSTVALTSDLQPVQPATVPEVQIHAPAEPVMVAPIAATPQIEIPVVPVPVTLPEKAPVVVVQTPATEPVSKEPPAPVMKTLVVKDTPAVAKVVRPMPADGPVCSEASSNPPFAC
jgi:anti-sigma factor RsiW